MKKIYIILSLFLSLSMGQECGNGECEAPFEDFVNCLSDCPFPVCGNGECEAPFENFVNCDSDCDSFCGDGIYDHSGVDFDGDGVFGNEDDTCYEDYGVTCGDGVYDWAGGETADGVDEGSEPDCDYTQTCGDGYYDYTANEVIICFNQTIWDGDFAAYINCESLCTDECAERNSCDYELICGDGFCDPINQEYNYCEIDCIVYGCINQEACNYNSGAIEDDGSCEYEQLQCRDLDGDGWGTSEFTITTCDIEGDIWVTNCDDIDDSIFCESNVVDCAGILCGESIVDECGICDGDNSSCLDECGVPNGDNSTCLDECGIPNGNGMEDFYADWDGDGFGDCSGEVYTYCPNEAESWMSSECDTSLGDINYDDEINVLDIVLMVNMILDGEYDVIADINEDDTVDILDIVTLVNWIMNGVPLCDGDGVELWGGYYDIDSTTNISLINQGLTGSIPPEIGCLTNLTFLSLGYNQLTGEIPAEIGNLVNLETLYLGFNQLTGEIPQEVCDLIASTTELGMAITNTTDGNNLINTCDISICHGLIDVVLWGEYYDIESTTYINLNAEGLTGSIPPEIGCLTNLTYLDVGQNQLTGSIPPEIGNLTNLTGLKLSNNQLTGEIPPEIGNLTNLYNLNLVSNQLTGEIPPEVCDLIESNNLNINYILDGNNLINTCE